ncbi:hypothetical protein [Sphingomonas aerophila]|jgi:hypothetical protein|uniref:Uncharacterized protein n=1 Tax=Sphingomonas aerophila TaxID=1344948 RepID=A0A7W9BEK6_9SPHN|nr:hypothetical protein [Sphingomonas aerophila]MBB5715809.1 hypothetical protein [Sphingomonas aerophila]
MSKTLLTLAAFGLLASANASADPREPKPAPSASPATNDGSLADRTASASQSRRYCIVAGDITGTRINRKICRTRDEWMKQGFDPLDPVAR